MTSEADRKKLNLDVVEDKEAVEEKIIERIKERLPDADHEEVEHAVKEEYEELLDHAKVTLHVPTLAEKKARDDIRENHAHDGEAEE